MIRHRWSGTGSGQQLPAIVPLTNSPQVKEQVHYITINGVKKPLAEWCEQYNISDSMVWKRLKRGWSPEEALEIVPREKTK